MTEDASKGRLDDSTFLSEDKSDMDQMIKTLVDQYPDITSTEAEKAIKDCCRILPEPHPNNRVYECARREIILLLDREMPVI